MRNNLFVHLWRTDRTGFWLVFTMVFNLVLFAATFLMGGRFL